MQRTVFTVPGLLPQLSSPTKREKAGNLLEDNIERIGRLDKTTILDDIRMLEGLSASIIDFCKGHIRPNS